MLGREASKDTARGNNIFEIAKSHIRGQGTLYFLVTEEDKILEVTDN